MYSLHKIGGLSGVLAGVAFIVATAAVIPVYVSAPSEALQPGNAEATLVFTATLSEAQRFAFRTLLSLQILSAVFMIPMLLALYSVLKDVRRFYALVGSGIAAVGIPFSILDALLGFPFIGPLSERFGVATAAERVALVAVQRFSQGLSQVSLALFWLLLGTAIVVFAFSMWRNVFPRWVAWLGLVTGVVMIIGTILSITVNQFFSLLQVMSFVIWAIAVGVTLYRLKGVSTGATTS